MNRAWARTLRLFPLIWLAGCASEGGVTGTGISAIVAGHVTVADGGSPADFEISADGLPASIDDTGNFEIAGDLSGPTELRFSPVGRPNPIGALRITIPAGSTTVLENITIDLLAAQPVTARSSAASRVCRASRTPASPSSSPTAVSSPSCFPTRS